MFSLLDDRQIEVNSLFERIVVPLDDTDESGQLIPYAADLLHAVGASLDQLALNYLHAVRDDLIREGAKSSVQRLVYGRPADGIVEVTREVETEHPGTLVIMTTHGRSGALRLAPSSVAGSVVHAVEQPVLVIHPSS
jgi:hypothetical protein